MSAFPSAERELRQVGDFLDRLERLDPAMNAVLETAQDHAQAYRTRLETPVRIAFAGKSAAGKSSLINLLIGERVLPSGLAAEGLPTTVVRHATTERTIASWWDRPSQAFPGRNLSAAKALSPDIVTLEIDCEALDGLSLIDIAGFDDAESSKRAVFTLMRLADVMLWCSRADNPMIKSDSDSWRLIPGRLIRNAMLVLTHAEDVSEAGIAEAKEKLTPDRLKSFRDVIPVSTMVALMALQNPGDDFEDLWSVSGAAQLVEAVIAAAVEVREAEIDKIRRGLQQFIAPAMAVLDGLEPRAAVAPAAPVPEPAPAPAEAPGPDLRALWASRLATVSRDLAAGDTEGNTEFIIAVQREVEGFVEDLAAAGGRDQGEEWLSDEFERANDLLILLQFETSDSAAVDAARILLQLTDSLVQTAR